MLHVRCQAHATLDDKGRVALPAPLRRALAEAGEAQLVLTFHKGAVWGWRPVDFEREVEAPLSAADPFADDVNDFAHSLLAPAQDVEIDKAGRIRIPPPLRDLAALDRDVVVNSLLNRVEIWDRAAWDDRFKQSLERQKSTSGMPGRQ